MDLNLFSTNLKSTQMKLPAESKTQQSIQTTPLSQSCKIPAVQSTRSIHIVLNPTICALPHQ